MLKPTKTLLKDSCTVANRIALANKNLSEAEVKSRAANELGYKVTATQLEIAAAEKELLDDDELVQVTGGGPRTGGKQRLPECTGKFFRGEISHCWDTNNGCNLIYN